MQQLKLIKEVLGKRQDRIEKHLKEIQAMVRKRDSAKREGNTNKN